MDNKVSSIIKRGLKVSMNYAMGLVLFLIFSSMVFGLAKDSVSSVMPWFSFLIALLTVMAIYVEMRTTAFKEKRPQYGINPSPFKGFIYGLIGIVPYLLIEIIILLVQVPTDLETLKLRLFQGVASPLYWLARLMGNKIPYYFIAWLFVVLIAALGYYAGYREFYVMAWIRQKLGIKPKKRVHRPQPQRKNKLF